MRPPRRIPRATYRLQLNAGFTFADAAALTDYLDALGISDCYASPVFAARPGSGHGYDVVDPSALNGELGGEEGFRGWTDRLRERGMGLLLDVVPNHMGIAEGNPWWTDVLENGPASPSARVFDIDWRPLKPDLADKVLLPVLGDQYGRVLEAGEISVARDDGGFRVRVHGSRLPLAPRSWTLILKPVLERLRRLGDEHPHVVELESILASLERLPLRTDTDPERVRERTREKEVARKRLAALLDACPEAASELAAELARLNGRPGDPRSFDALERLLAEQAYRLAYWRVAADEVNYRRFFDINELAAIRVELPEVFAAVHGLLFRLVGEGRVTGLRVDHIDGLYDPERYLEDLQAACPGTGPLHVVVEKILSRGERLRSSWAAHGTTGYDALNLLNGLLVDPRGERLLRAGYARFTGRARAFAEVVRDCKKLTLLVSMSSELHMLAAALDRISEQHRFSRDFTMESLRFALREVIASYEVYRTYVSPRDESASAEDLGVVAAAVRRAKRANPATDESVFDFVGSVLALRHPDGLGAAEKAARREFVLRLQQLTGAVTAKSVEDTAFYRHTPLASLNEVGGGPERFGVSPAEFHDANAERLGSWPHSLVPTTTHDAKRGEDVRARLDCLCEIPQRWQAALLRWREMNRPHKTDVEGSLAPDPNEEHLLYQTLVGTWPFEPEAAHGEEYRGRLKAYMVKALREAKVNSSWFKPNLPHEAAAERFIDRLLEPGSGFAADFKAFHAPVLRAGVLNSLAQTLLKLAVPGIPDFYQGGELWDLSLVDPDNRRPVDYGLRRRLLETTAGSRMASLLAAPADGAVKLQLIRRALALRRARPGLFASGEYRALEPQGPRRRNVCAFARLRAAEAVVASAGRLFLGLPQRPWEDTHLRLPRELAGAAFRDALTGRRVQARRSGRAWLLPAAEAFAELPCALLERTR